MKEIERIKEQMKEMIHASANLDKLEDQIYPDGDGSEMAKELRKKEYRLRKLREAREGLAREKLEKVNVTEPDSRLMQDNRGVIQPSYNRGLMKVWGEFLLMCLVHNVKKSVKRVIEGAVHLPGKYSKRIEEAMLGYREEDLALVGAEV